MDETEVVGAAPNTSPVEILLYVKPVYCWLFNDIVTLVTCVPVGLVNWLLLLLSFLKDIGPCAVVVGPNAGVPTKLPVTISSVPWADVMLLFITKKQISSE